MVNERKNGSDDNLYSISCKIYILFIFLLKFK